RAARGESLRRSCRGRPTNAFARRCRPTRRGHLGARPTHSGSTQRSRPTTHSDPARPILAWASQARAASWHSLRSRPTRRRESLSRRSCRRRARGTTRRARSAHSEQDFHRELIELLVGVALPPHRLEVERALLQLAGGVSAELHALTRR